MNEPLPGPGDFDPTGGFLDAEFAMAIFLGKSLEEAEELFRENFLARQEDLMFMGTAAFCFYVQSAIRYILGETSRGDDTVLVGFPGAVTFQLENGTGAIEDRSLLGHLGDATEYVLSHWDKFSDTPGGRRSWERLLRDLRSRTEA